MRVPSIKVCLFSCNDALSFAYALLCCRYQGPADGRDVVTRKAMVRYTWSVRAPGVYETSDVEVRCDHAIERGVHPSKAWKNKIGWRTGAPAVDEFADKACQRARADLGLGDDVKLGCRPVLLQRARAP